MKELSALSLPDHRRGTALYDTKWSNEKSTTGFLEKADATCLESVELCPKFEEPAKKTAGVCRN